MKKTALAAVLLCLLPLVSNAAQKAPVDPDADYDRLDGKGPSGKRVDVIEWEGNLEVHVYPGGSLRGLALKLDKRNKDKPVMVIGYRFDNDPKKQLIRRNILGIPMSEDFKVFRDPSAGSEYDKIVISNNTLSGQLVAYKLDPAPTQLYPDGYPATGVAAAENTGTRKPAEIEPDRAVEPQDSSVDEDGAIQPFFMQKKAPEREPQVRGRFSH